MTRYHAGNAEGANRGRRGTREDGDGHEKMTPGKWRTEHDMKRVRHRGCVR